MRGSRDLLSLTPRRSRLAAGRRFAVLAKRGDPAKSLLEQHARMTFVLLGGLSNLLAELAYDPGKSDPHLVTECGEPLAHFLSESRDFLPKPRFDVCKADPHLATKGRELGPHLSPKGRTFEAYPGSELRNLHLYSRHPPAERGHILSQAGDFRRQCVESFHGLLQAFYAIRQQFIRHHTSVSTRRSTSTRALDGRTNARCVPTTLPSSRRADNNVRMRTGRWRRVDVMPTFGGA